MKELIRSIIAISLIGLIGYTVAKATPTDKRVAVISCEPVKALTYGAGSNGQVIPVENWMADCIISQDGKVLFHGDYEPTINFPETKAQAEVEDQVIIKDISEYMRELRFGDDMVSLRK